MEPKLNILESPAFLNRSVGLFVVYVNRDFTANMEADCTSSIALSLRGPSGQACEITSAMTSAADLITSTALLPDGLKSLFV